MGLGSRINAGVTYRVLHFVHYFSVHSRNPNVPRVTGYSDDAVAVFVVHQYILEIINVGWIARVYNCIVSTSIEV